MIGWNRRDLAGDLAAVAVGLVWAAVVLWVEIQPDGVSPAEALGVALGAVAFLAVPLRRSRPVAYWAAVNALALAAPVVSWLVLVAIFSVAVRRRWPVAVPVTGASLVVSAVDLWGDPGPYLQLFGFVAALTVAVAASGLFVGARRELLASLRERAERAEAEQAERAEQARTAERRRIAREMHDVLGHRLSLLSVHAGALELRDDLPPAAVRRTAGVLRETTRAALDDLREIVLVLREPALDAPQPRLADVADLVAESRAAGAVVELADEVPDAPPEQLGRTAYRVVQEGLTNARRHAAGSPVEVSVSGGPGSVLAVRIVSGPGRPSGGGSGTGLIGLRERVALAGGELRTGIEPDGRHVLSARMPWPVR